MTPKNRLNNIFDSEFFVHNELIDYNNNYTKNLLLNVKENMRQKKFDFNIAYHIIIINELNKLNLAKIEEKNEYTQKN